MSRLVQYGAGDIPLGGQAWLDNNLPVTVDRVIPPMDDDDPGSVAITYGWGASDTVQPSRLGAYIAD